MHECRKGRNCGRAPLNDTADLAESHRVFNPVQRWLGSLVINNTAKTMPATAAARGVRMLSRISCSSSFIKNPLTPGSLALVAYKPAKPLLHSGSCFVE